MSERIRICRSSVRRVPPFYFSVSSACTCSPFFTSFALSFSTDEPAFQAHSYRAGVCRTPPRAWKFALVTSRGSSVGRILAHVELDLGSPAAYRSLQQQNSTPIYPYPYPAAFKFWRHWSCLTLACSSFACSPYFNNDGPNAQPRDEQWSSERGQWEWEWKHEG